MRASIALSTDITDWLMAVRARGGKGGGGEGAGRGGGDEVVEACGGDG